MYRSEDLRARQESDVRAQQALVQAWKATSFDVRDTYGPRLREVLESALSLGAYREIYGSAAVDGVRRLLAGPEPLSHTRVLRRLPFTTKADAHQIGLDVLRARRGSLSNYFETSGTTGAPTPAPKSPRDLVANTVNFGEHWAEFLRESDVALILLNTPQGPAPFQFERVLNYLDILTLRTWIDTLRNDYARVVEMIARLHPTIYVGSPSQLLSLYEHVAGEGLVPPAFRLALLSGERTSNGLRRRLEHLTQGEVVDASFGSSETGTTAIAVGARHLRLQTQSFIFELLDGESSTFVDDATDATGELVVTSLENLSRPLVRYRTGDLVHVSAQESGEHLVVPQGRVGELVRFGDVAASQETIEESLWPPDRVSRVYNYLVAYDLDRVDLLVTTDDVTDVELHEDLAVISRLIPGLRIHRVRELPSTSGLGSALGWKATRIYRLDEEFASELPPALRQSLRDGHDHVRRIRASGASGDAVGAPR